MGKKQPLYQSFRYAFEGIFTGIRKERNMKIHCLGVICVTAAGAVLIAAIMAAFAGVIIFLPKAAQLFVG